MATKVHVTRTYAPLQFEALEPHRFEDLVRDLLYGYRDWQRIEATGRGGSDDGFDIRAYEKAITTTQREADQEEEAEEPVVVEGNLWMIQCKREKQLSAARIVSIIDEAVKPDEPPYGYVLAAPVNFTKKSYDAFRSALVDRGVSEFQLLGRAELEDMLYQPKNDRVLFAFFGISLVSRRRSRVTEIRSAVNNKNKLFRILGDAAHDRTFSQNVLIRDTNDTHYPDADEYPDFRTKPRWKEFIACAHHTQGVRFHMKRHFAYVDQVKNEWDFVPSIDLLLRRVPLERDDAAMQAQQDLHDRVKDYWEHLPLWHQGERAVDGIILYRDFELIDKEGDAKYQMPHLYVDFTGRKPFSGYWDYLMPHHEREHFRIDDYKKVSVFPAEFPKVRFGKIYKDQLLEVPSYIAYRLREGQHCYFDVEDKYGFLEQRDIIGLPNPDTRNSGKLYAEVMYKQRGKVADLLKTAPNLKSEMQQQLNMEAKPKELVTVFQLKQVYDFVVERREQAEVAG